MEKIYEIVYMIDKLRQSLTIVILKTDMYGLEWSVTIGGFSLYEVSIRAL